MLDVALYAFMKLFENQRFEYLVESFLRTGIFDEASEQGKSLISSTRSRYRSVILSPNSAWNSILIPFRSTPISLVSFRRFTTLAIPSDGNFGFV